VTAPPGGRWKEQEEVTAVAGIESGPRPLLAARGVESTRSVTAQFGTHARTAGALLRTAPRHAARIRPALAVRLPD
jgi:hypothetical protein